MKKWLLSLLIISGIAIVCVYFFIPAKIAVTTSVPVTANQDGALRFLSSTDNWKKFWSENEYSFTLDKVLYNAIQLSLIKDKDSIESNVFILPYQLDSFKLQWTTLLPPSNNPITRIQNYFTGKKIKKVCNDMLQHLATALNKVETIYGINVKKEKVQFQHFLSTKKGFGHYPTVNEIYSLIDEARNYVAKAGAKVVDNPIFTVMQTEGIDYLTQVALPIDKDIPNEDVYAHKWMMKGGNILTAEVKGGNQSIESAKNLVQQYIIDYRRSVIAIPFEMFITDRRTEPDSSKWITRLYFPVI